MQDLKYTTLEDIKEFLKTLNYSWKGNIKVAGKVQPAHIEHLRYSACLIVKNIKTNKYKHITIFVSDDYFHIVKNNPKKKYDIINHSIAWQAFMIQRKTKDYAKFVYKKAKQEKQKLEKKYDCEIGLLKKQAEFLEYQRSLKTAALNTTLLNAEFKLNKNKTPKNDNQLENTTLDK